MLKKVSVKRCWKPGAVAGGAVGKPYSDGPGKVFGTGTACHRSQIVRGLCETDSGDIRGRAIFKEEIAESLP